VLADELELILGLRDEVQRDAAVVRDLDHLVLVVLGDDGAPCPGRPVARSLDLVDGLGELDVGRGITSPVPRMQPYALARRERVMDENLYT
jgi:hypothetical protein